VTPRNLSPYSGLGLDSLTVIPPAENYPDTVSLFSKNILTASRTASAVLSSYIAEERGRMGGWEKCGAPLWPRLPPRRSFDLCSFLSLSLLPSLSPSLSLSLSHGNPVSLARERKKPIGRTDQLNAY